MQLFYSPSCGFLEHIYNGQKFREMRISRYVMRNLISRNIQCEFRITENKGFFEVLRAFIGPSELLIIEKNLKTH